MAPVHLLLWWSSVRMSEPTKWAYFSANNFTQFRQFGRFNKWPEQGLKPVKKRPPVHLFEGGQWKVCYIEDNWAPSPSLVCNGSMHPISSFNWLFEERPTKTWAWKNFRNHRQRLAQRMQMPKHHQKVAFVPLDGTEPMATEPSCFAHHWTLKCHLLMVQ